MNYNLVNGNKRLLDMTALYISRHSYANMDIIIGSVRAKLINFKQISKVAMKGRQGVYLA